MGSGRESRSLKRCIRFAAPNRTVRIGLAGPRSLGCRASMQSLELGLELSLERRRPPVRGGRQPPSYNSWDLCGLPPPTRLDGVWRILVSHISHDSLVSLIMTPRLMIM